MKDEEYAYQVMAEAGGDFDKFCTLIFDDPLHPGQKRYAEEASEKHNLLCPGNSWGKTELLTRLHLFWNTYKDGVMGVTPRKRRFVEYKTLNASYTYDISDLVFDRIIGYASEIKFVNWLITHIQRRERQIIFQPGSMLKIGSTDNRGKLIEAERYYRITLDEVGYEQEMVYLRNKILMPRAIVPYSKGGGRLHYVGTPKEFSDPELFQMFSKGLRRDNNYYARKGSTYENIYLPDEDILMLEEEYKDDPTALKQVLYGEFISAGGTVFRAEAVRRAIWNHISWPEPYREGRLYLTAWDFARRKDHTVGVTVDISEKPYRVVNYIRVPKADAEWSYIYMLVKEEAARYKVRQVVIDKSGMGGDIIEDTLSKMGLPIEGIDFGGMAGTKKINIVQSLVDALDELVYIDRHDEDRIRELSAYLDSGELQNSKFAIRGIVKFPPIDQLVRELCFYSWDDKKLQTDSVMALAMITYWMKQHYAPPATSEDLMALFLR